MSGPTTRTRLARTVMAAAVLGTATLAVAGTAAPAQAWPWSPNVTVTGAIYCSGSNVIGIPENVSWAWVSSDGGSAGWASVWRSGNQIRYSAPVRVATWGSNITIKVGCQVTGQRITSFRTARPAVGTTVVRDLRWI